MWFWRAEPWTLTSSTCFSSWQQLWGWSWAGPELLSFTLTFQGFLWKRGGAYFHSPVFLSSTPELPTSRLQPAPCSTQLRPDSTFLTSLWGTPEDDYKGKTNVSSQPLNSLTWFTSYQENWASTFSLIYFHIQIQAHDLMSHWSDPNVCSMCFHFNLARWKVMWANRKEERIQWDWWKRGPDCTKWGGVRGVL